MNTIGVIGWGFVGQATGKGLTKNKGNKLFIYDKQRTSPLTLEEVVQKSEFIFICVPTPMHSDYSGMSMAIVDEVAGQVATAARGTDKIAIVKSTVLPGTVASYIKKYPKINWAMNPEFLTQNNANKDFLNPARTVIGASSPKVGERIKKLYQTIYPKSQPYYLMDTTSAELTKYMSNNMLATKVLIADEFYFLAKKVKADYNKVREAVEADPRIGTHLKVPGPDGDVGFGGACFPKDMIGVLGLSKKLKVDMSALSAIWQKNLKIRKNRDWEHMTSAFREKKK
jgi:nucleotide sugar dehydrogenase